jgi:uncharacterized protein (DUF433 family)
MKSRKIKKIGDPMSGGFYSAAEAGRLLHIKFPGKISHWLTEHPKEMGPLIKRQYEVIDGQQTLSFLDLMEARSINCFRDKGVSLKNLRIAAINLRKILKVDHPFSTLKTKLVTDRREIFIHSAEETGDDILLSLVTKQYGFYEVWEQFLEEGIAFNMETGLPESWVPVPNKFPDVMVDPRFAYGHPTISKNHVPTSTLYKLWQAEKDYKTVGEWYGVKKADVKEAVQFEESMAA